MEIKKIKHGIACRIGDIIYINRLFDKDPELRDFLINHEKEHSTALKLKDVKMDLDLFGKGNPLKKRYIEFLKRNPQMWTEFLPITIYDKKLIFNTKLIILYSAAIIFLWALKLIF